MDFWLCELINSLVINALIKTLGQCFIFFAVEIMIDNLHEYFGQLSDFSQSYLHTWVIWEIF